MFLKCCLINCKLNRKHFPCLRRTMILYLFSKAVELSSRVRANILAAHHHSPEKSPLSTWLTRAQSLRYVIASNNNNNRILAKPLTTHALSFLCLSRCRLGTLGSNHHHQSQHQQQLQQQHQMTHGGIPGMNNGQGGGGPHCQLGGSSPLAMPGFPLRTSNSAHASHYSPYSPSR